MTRAVDVAIRVLSDGGLVVYPTDTLYGLGARIDRAAAVARIFLAKNRPPTMPLSIAVADVGGIDRVAIVTPLARKLFPLLPGPLTLVLERRPAVPSIVTGGESSVGVRVPNHPTALELLRAAGAVTATSANRHGEPDPSTIDEARSQLGDRADYYLASPSPLLGAASTLVDARGDTPRILRPGAVSDVEIRRCLGQ